MLYCLAGRRGRSALARRCGTRAEVHFFSYRYGALRDQTVRSCYGNADFAGSRHYVKSHVLQFFAVSNWWFSVSDMRV